MFYTRDGHFVGGARDGQVGAVCWPALFRVVLCTLDFAGSRLLVRSSLVRGAGIRSSGRVGPRWSGSQGSGLSQCGSETAYTALPVMPPKRSVVAAGGGPSLHEPGASAADVTAGAITPEEQKHVEPTTAEAAAAAAAEKKRLKNKAKREKAKAKKLAQAGGPTAEAKKLLDEGDAAAAFALLAPRQNDPSPPKLLHRCALRWRQQCVNTVVSELSKGDSRNLQVSPLPDVLASYLRRSGEECVWRLPKTIHPLLAAPLYCRFAFHEGPFDAEAVAPDDIKCTEESIDTAKGDMEALQRPNCAGVLVPTGRVPQAALSAIVKDGLEDWPAYWRLRASAVPRLPQLRRERGGNTSLLPVAINQRLSTNHLTIPLTILWAAREHGVDISCFIGKGKAPLIVHVVGAEEETEARNAVSLRTYRNPVSDSTAICTDIALPECQLTSHCVHGLLWLHRIASTRRKCSEKLLCWSPISR